MESEEDMKAPEVEEQVVQEQVVEDIKSKYSDPDHCEPPTTQERLKKAREEAKELAEQLKKERIENKSKAVDMRAARDSKLEEVGLVLKGVQELIHGYNKLGKVKKAENDIVGRIRNVCSGYLNEKAEE